MLQAADFLEGQIILLDKPLDWTSFQAVNKIKFKLKNQFDLPKKFKIGHAGTLDPQASGLLIICTGKFTKIIPEIQNAPKEYLVEIKIGAQTISYDSEQPEIEIIDYSRITEDQIANALEKFKGDIMQTPPVFSAIKINGNRAYDLARQGVEVEMKSRPTTIHYLNNVKISLPFISFTVGCSKGTYIRSLAHDIGQELEVGAYLTKLRRSKIGDFTIENATAEFLENDFDFLTFAGQNFLLNP